jgi:hypothetical protein
MQWRNTQSLLSHFAPIPRRHQGFGVLAIHDINVLTREFPDRLTWEVKPRYPLAALFG